MPFIDFQEVEVLATIEELSQMLGLKTKRYNASQLRCSCPVHGGEDTTLAISPGVRSKRGSEGVFYCQKGKSGGDRIGLVAHCMDIGQQDAAFFIQEQYGNSEGTVDSTVSKNRATVPKAPTRRVEKEETSATNSQRAPEKLSNFDPVKFAAKLIYSDEVEALGLTEEDATKLGVGWHPQRKTIYFPQKDDTGFVCGFIGFANGELKMPPRWLEQSKVVKLKRA